MAGFRPGNGDAIMNVNNEAEPLTRNGLFRNVVRTGYYEGWDEAGSPLLHNPGWGVWLPGLFKRIPKLVTPFSFNQKKWS